MKKLLSLLLVFSLIFALAACSSTQTTTTTEATEAATEAPTEAPTDEPTAEPTDEPTAEPTADTDTESSADSTDTTTKTKLVVGTSVDFPPYEYYDGDQIVGIEVEMMEKIAEKLDMDFELVDMSFDSIIAAVVSHKIDIGMSGFTVTEERKQSVDFSVSYIKAKQSIVVPEGSPITTVDDLYAEGATYAVGVQNSTTGDLYITEDVETKGLKLDIQRFNKYPDIIAALKSGKLECAIIDDQVAKAFVEENSDLKMLDTAYADEDYALCMSKENSELLEKINQALEEMIADGSMQAIIDKYIQ